jgi:hypothetical protein
MKQCVLPPYHRTPYRQPHTHIVWLVLPDDTLQRVYGGTQDECEGYARRHPALRVKICPIPTPPEVQK